MVGPTNLFIDPRTAAARDSRLPSFSLNFLLKRVVSFCHAPTCRDACSLYSRLCHLLEKEKPLILFTATLCTGGDGKSFEFFRRLLEKEKPGSLMDRSASLIACSRSE
ncbi:hypothetical protein POPTR_001G142150v4 [Populus trichocarpa]|jgi:hypothetical protein|uniref:Uncharacterized protein n=1 Tax=Populus trichocarpa TaxID=3694 RepID=A0A3N7FBL2_POPTR|nr:hypothetical protein POPTR_001G142150v4 [Populus trichocarpa]